VAKKIDIENSVKENKCLSISRENSNQSKPSNQMILLLQFTYTVKNSKKWECKK
jgi:hypothetical protein